MNSTESQLLQHVGAKLKGLRQKQRLSKEEVKAATRISVTEIEAGKKDIKVDVLAVLCDHYHTSLFDFFKEIEKRMASETASLN
jgi:transcriptional regulator with XRE-family HTH domain